MNTKILKQADMFHAINDMAIKGEIVIFGSSFTANFPFYELSQSYVMSNAIYNRSISDITIKDAIEVLQQCVIDIKPRKVFLCFGESEPDLKVAIADYKKLIYKLKEKLPNCDIFVLSVKEIDDETKSFNESLLTLTERENVKFLKINYDDDNGIAKYKKVFKKLSCFFRNNTLDLTDAFIVASK